MVREDRPFSKPNIISVLGAFTGVISIMTWSFGSFSAFAWYPCQVSCLVLEIHLSGPAVSSCTTWSPTEMQRCFSLPSKLHVLDAGIWPTYHMPLMHRVSEDKRGYYMVNSYDDMPLSRSPCSCEPQWKEHYSWLSFIFKIKIIIYYLSYHSTCFSHVNTWEKPEENGNVSKLCC